MPDLTSPSPSWMTQPKRGRRPRSTSRRARCSTGSAATTTTGRRRRFTSPARSGCCRLARLRGCELICDVPKDATLTYDDGFLPGQLVDELLEAHGRLPVGVTPWFVAKAGSRNATASLEQIGVKQ
jgi:hypothetical protein